MLSSQQRATGEIWALDTDVRYKWVKEKIKNGELTVSWVETRKMKADSLTKPLNPTKQAHFIWLIGLSEVIAKKGRERETPSGEQTGCSGAWLTETAV
jgi:hypothetical protein